MISVPTPPPSLSDIQGRVIAAITAKAGPVIPAIDGLQPDVGHEVLWVLRDVLSGEVLLARSLLSSCLGDLAVRQGDLSAARQLQGLGADHLVD